MYSNYQPCVCSCAGSALLTAGYCLYSSSTIFVLTTGKGVYGFTLDPLVGEFILSHDNVKVCSSCHMSMSRCVHPVTWRCQGMIGRIIGILSHDNVKVWFTATWHVSFPITTQGSRHDSPDMTQHVRFSLRHDE